MENLVFSCGCLFIIVNRSIGERERGLLYICCIVITGPSDFSSVLLLQSEPHHWCFFPFLLYWQQEWTLGRIIQVPMSVGTYCQTLFFFLQYIRYAKKTYICTPGAFPSFTIVFIIGLVCICSFCFYDALFPNRHMDIVYNFTYYCKDTSRMESCPFCSFHFLNL